MCFLELTLYAFDGISSKYAGTILDRYLRYKDIQLTYGIPNEQSIYGDWVDKDSRNDLIYENVIEGDYIEEADEIDLKICTNPDGKLALSSVTSNGVFLKQIKSIPFGVTDIPENILIQKVVDLFNEPRFQIDPIVNNNVLPYSRLTDKNLPGHTFLCAGGDEDVKMEKIRLNLIEL